MLLAGQGSKGAAAGDQLAPGPVFDDAALLHHQDAVGLAQVAEAVAPLLDKTIEGFGELFRVLSFETIGTSTLQSRCLAGVANGTVIFVLPGSLDAVETAWDRLIAAQLDVSTRPCNLVQLLPRLTEPAG